MDVRSVARNVSVAFFAQIITFLASLVVTLLVPKVLNVESFGYWQLFIFYSNYVGFFMLGLNDGCYLINGGKQRSNLNKKNINSQFVIGLVFECVVGLCLAVAILCMDLGESRSFVIYCISIFIPLRCSAAFLGYLFQAINETKLYSLSCILERLVFLSLIGVFLVMKTGDFRLYILAFCFSTFCQFLYCCIKGLDIIKAGYLPLLEGLKEVAQSIRVGIKLMLANIASSLVLGIARAAIDSVWGISSFGQLSLSLSLCNFFLTFISQFAMVLFPSLRQSSDAEVKTVIRYTSDFLSLVMPVVFLLQFPLYLICIQWLPQYAQGLGYLALTLPICVFDSKTNLCCFTYYKVARLEKHMLIINIITVLISTVCVCIGIFFFKNVDAVIMSVVLCIVARSLYCEYDVCYKLELEQRNLLIFGELLITAAFLISHYVCEMRNAAAVCIMTYVIFIAINKESLNELLEPIVRRIRH